MTVMALHRDHRAERAFRDNVDPDAQSALASRPAAMEPVALAEETIPDLLGEEAAVRIDLDDLHQTLVFGFALGTSIEALEKPLVFAKLPPSSWDATDFARDVFLEDLVTRALRIRIGGRLHAPVMGYLLRAVAEPPMDVAVVRFRQAILAELAESPELRRDFERAYVRIGALRSTFTSEAAARRGGDTHRRLEILRGVEETIHELASGFGGATSGLARLRAFALSVKQTEAFQRLEALLDHERHLGTVDLRVQVGLDGTLRTFQVLGLRENQTNPFHTSAIGRFFSKLRLLLFGYRVTPGEVAERLLDDVFNGLERTMGLLLQVHGDMEFYLAGLGLADLAREKGLPICLPELRPREEGGGMELRRLYNPLLAAGKTRPLPCDLKTGHADSVVIVTGPNSGGKTRLLQSIGIVQMLGQAGLFVTAEKASLPHLSGMFVSLVEEAKSDQPEGQLGMELLRIRRLFEDLGFGSLILLDELCSGTNPSEGEEIARLVISLLPELRSPVLMTTHLLSLATCLEKEPPIAHLELLQVELDENERPTYQFIPGVAKTSLAHKTAERLGVTRDELGSLIARKKRSLDAGETPKPQSRRISPKSSAPKPAPEQRTSALERRRLGLRRR